NPTFFGSRQLERSPLPGVALGLQERRLGVSQRNAGLNPQEKMSGWVGRAFKSSLCLVDIVNWCKLARLN
ncbi:MAG: hypothetical protein ACO20O_13975, partial [Pseudomonadales bacterium]